MRSFAGSRDFGTAVREQIQAELQSATVVIVDLEGLSAMTPSFADECFGKLSESLGFDVTGRSVRVEHGDRYLPLIEAVTKRRLAGSGSQPPHSP